MLALDMGHMCMMCRAKHLELRHAPWLGFHRLVYLFSLTEYLVVFGTHPPHLNAFQVLKIESLLLPCFTFEEAVFCYFV